jgi:hypothetical protein
MERDQPRPAVRVGEGPDGIRTYLVDRSPELLPAVRGRDIELAWDAARGFALSSRRGAVCGFRFMRGDGTFTDLALADRDARCWAGAVDATVGLDSPYGLSICLRLLALVDLLARAGWAAGLLRMERNGANLHPSLLRAAAGTPLTADGRFDEAGFRARVPVFILPGVTESLRLTGANA